MSTLIKYRIHCDVDGWVETDYQASPPTTCPINASHIVNENSVQELDTAAPTMSYFDAYLTTETSIADAWVDMPLDVQRQVSSDFTHTAGEAEITINTTSKYSISCRCTINNSSGASRTTSMVKLQQDTGGGYTDILGTLGFMYNREADAGYNTCTVSCVIDLNAGDKIKAHSKRDQGYGPLTYTNEGCSVTIIRITTF